MPRTEPERWKLGKRLNPTRLPSSTVIFFTLIVLECVCVNFYPFCYAHLSISGRAGRFSCVSQCVHRGQKASVEVAARPGYPNFRIKFVEAHGCRRLRKALRHLTMLPDTLTLHDKNASRRGQIAMQGKPQIPIISAISWKR